MDLCGRALAHSANTAGNAHDLEQHLRDVARRSGEFARKFGAADLACWAGLWHDLGKYHPDFQAYLNDPSARRGPDHSSAGAVLAASHCDALSFLIAGHHAGLPSFSHLKSRLAEKRNAEATRIAQEIAGRALGTLAPAERLDACLPEWISPRDRYDDQRLRNRELFVRMLFSALVDADFLDTEMHFHPERVVERDGYPSLPELWRRFEEDQATLTGKHDTLLQHARHAIYQACLRAATLPPGWFRLTVPTGGGKTRSGMAFALRHALCHPGVFDRVIVAIPYTSIIEQTAEVYLNIFQGEGVLEHHSAVPDRYEEQNPVTARQQWSRLASENWDAPVIVSTTVQLFESLFANRPSKTRKLHNLARSVLILDEVQTLPPHLLDPVLDVLGQLVEHYSVSVVLCTATQPALGANRYAKGLSDRLREIVPDPDRYFQALKRVEYETRIGEKWGWERGAEEMHTSSQALAIVNTKKDALALLDALGEDPSVLHLSTQMCGAHRAETLHEVKERLDAARPCRLVATQVVEAGVDIDFPVVLRAIGPLDRIIQAAGRCNREGKPSPGRVVIFDPADGGSPAGAYRTGLDTALAILQAGCDLHDPAVYERYFTLLFGAVETDRAGIQGLRAALDYEEVARLFRLIEDDGAPVAVRPRGHEAKVDRLLAIIRHADEPPRWAIRKLQPFLVNLRSQQVAAYELKGLLRAVAPGLWEWQGRYDSVRGLVDAAIDPDLLTI
jgi:CRISPR-associated endonuclease/helicase Cas3